MDKSLISLEISATGPDLLVTVRFDQTELYHGSPRELPEKITHDFDDSGSVHLLEITLAGKMPKHTLLSPQGEILEDRLAQIRNVKLDDIPLEYLFTSHAEYHHSNNTSGPEIQDKFYGDMGCNGTVRFSFASPVYLWLLENM